MTKLLHFSTYRYVLTGIQSLGKRFSYWMLDGAMWCLARKWKSLLVMMMMMALVLISLMAWLLHHHTVDKPSTLSSHVQVATSATTPPPAAQLTLLSENLATLRQQWQRTSQQLQTQVNQFDQQMTRIQKRLPLLASQSTINQLTKTMKTNQTVLLQHLQTFQATMKTVVNPVQSTLHWQSPTNVNRYFRLTAVQGFSDGMRAIIDVNGHQTTLAVHESCPACRGWTVQKLDFIHQQAIFQKQVGKQIQWVKLTVGGQ